MKLYVIRHGETTWNVERKLQGASDTELNENGIALAIKTGKAMKEIPFDLCFTSPLKRGVAVDYAMNTLCAAGTGSFLSSQAKRLGVEVEDFGKIALTSKHPTQLAARCTVFAESDLVHKIQMGHTKEDIIAGLCRSVVNNYLNNVGKGKKIVSPVVFQGGVSKNIGVVEAFKKALGCDIIVDENGHLMGALGIAILAGKGNKKKVFDFSVEDMVFKTREINCGRCPNNCEIICVYRDDMLIDSWGNRCDKGALKAGTRTGVK